MDATEPIRKSLVVDDERMVRELMITALSMEGFLGCTAKNGAEARRILQRPTHFDLILLDLTMPGESGWDLLSWIRNRPDTSGTPVVLLTSLESTGVYDEPKASQVDGIFVKGRFSLHTFHRVIARAMRDEDD